MTKAGSTIALQVDAQGNVAYDAIAKRGHSSKQIVQAQFKDLVPLNERADIGEISLSRPTEEEVQETADRTRAALEKISKCKIEDTHLNHLNGHALQQTNLVLSFLDSF